MDVKSLGQRTMQGVQRAASCGGGVLVGEGNRSMQGLGVDRVERHKLSGVQVFDDKLACGSRLIFGGFPAKDFELERRSDFEIVQRSVNKRTTNRLGSDEFAVRLRIVEFDQTTGVEIDHGLVPAARDQFT